MRSRLSRLRVPGVAFVCALLAATRAAGAETGSIRGVVDDPGRVVSVKAVDRAQGRTFPGSLKTAAGAFSVDDLPPGASYDLVIDLADGRLEGIDMRVPRSDYVEEQPLSDEDRETILKKLDAMNKFEDRMGVLALAGNIQHAVVLINKLRTKPFYASQPGEVVWRAERWRFERPEETWVKVQDELFTVLYRERLPASAYARKSILFDAALGGLDPGRNGLILDVGRITLPRGESGIRVRNVVDPVTPED